MPVRGGAQATQAIQVRPAAVGARKEAASVRPKTEEVMVTSSRRSQTLISTPYNLFVVSGAALKRAGVSDLASLSYQVPGLSTYDLGARMAGATSPIIRGINADGAPIGNHMAEQSPVGTYINNSPSDGYFQLDDIKRVEVLRGPQGTLYGAGALGGALRIIPNSAELGVFSGHVEGSGGDVGHSSHAANLSSGFINIPVGRTFAIRVAGRYSYDPGFINADGILQRSGSAVSGVPVLADPSQPVTSSGIFSRQKDWNWQHSFTGRVSMVWKPIEKLNIELASIYSSVSGNGGPQVNLTYPGGAYPNDPRITFPAGGNYQDFSAIEQPFHRKSNLSSLDASYDLGFATISSTTSYALSHGTTITDDTYGQAVYTFSYPYYSGNPTNPRFVSPFRFKDSRDTFSEELRLVSDSHPGNLFDYVLGFFYEKQNTRRIWDISAPGSPEYSQVEGCTSPYVAGASFPNCQVVAGPGDLTFAGDDHQSFEDKSVFGEVTWHFLPHGQLTFGGRHFAQSFTDSQSYSVYTFNSYVPAVARSSPTTRNTFKVNPSYEYAKNHYIYALWSQGFRRGGANSVPLDGPFRESAQLQSYKSDSTNNFEIGMKGRFPYGLTYTIDFFDILWDNPQIGGITAAGNYAVWNAKKAESRGVEFDLSGRLPVDGLSFVFGAAYADAKLTRDYSIATGNGAGDIVAGVISGTKGSQLPGSPKLSTSFTLTYSRQLVPGYEMTASINNTYKSSIPVMVLIPGTSGGRSSPNDTTNLSVMINHGRWTFGVYAKNLTNQRTLIFPHAGPVGTLFDNSTVNRPREVGVRAGVDF